MKQTVFIFTHDGPEDRLDRVLMMPAAAAAGLAGATRSQLKRWIESGVVSVDDQPAGKAGTLIKSGARIVVRPPQEITLNMPYEFPLDICFEDEALAVLNKPPGLSMHPGAGNKHRTLVNALIAHYGQTYFGSDKRAGIVHRLDKDTTGLVVVAKNAAVLHSLAQQFSRRTVRREYLALALATPRGKSVFAAADHGQISLPIGRHPTRRKEMAVLTEGSSGARRAVTSWQRLERWNYGYLLRLKLETGRTHQIRVHLGHAGAPIIGDRVYGNFDALPDKLKHAADTFGRQALHAQTLGFVHPDGRELLFQVDPPADFIALAELFRNE